MQTVVLIGGGSSAALSSVRLAERGFRVIALEKARRGNGSSSRSMAGIRAQFGVEETVIGMRYSEWWYAHFHEHLRTPAEQAAVPVMRQNGYLFLFEDSTYPDPAWDDALRQELADAWQQAQTNVAMQQQLGLPVRILPPAEITRQWPHLNTERLIGATWCPEDGFLIPDMIYLEGFRRAQELGEELREQTEVLGARVSGERIVALETTRGLVEGDLFVNCTNAWAPRTSQRIGGMPLPVAPTKRYLYFWKAEQPVMEPERWHRMPMTIYGMGRHRGAHARPEHELLCLACLHQAPPETDFTDADQDIVRPGYSHLEGVDNFGYSVLEQAATFMPSLAESGGLVATTTGFYGMTPDGSPLIGFDARLRNLVHAVGFSGHGLMHAPITAVLVEALVAGDVVNGQVRLPPPFEGHTLNLAAFNPSRDFSHSNKESHVL